MSGLLDLDVSPGVFEKNLQIIGITENVFLQSIMNVFYTWGPQQAFKQVISNKSFISSAIEEWNNVLNIAILLSSPTLINFEDVKKIIEAQTEKAEVPKSPYLTEVLKYSSNHQNLTDSSKYSILLLFYLQSPRSKARLLFDLFDINNDGFLSQEEIKEVLESGTSKSKINVNADLIEELCQTLGKNWH